MERSHLYQVLKEAGATFGVTFGWEMPQVFSTPEEEYQAASKSVALSDRSYIGRLKATGKDALDLINRLSTNKLEDLAPGEAMPTVLTNNKARILDYLLVVRMEDDLLLLTSPQNRQKVADWIDLYTFLEESEVEDITSKTALVSLIGPEARDLLRNLGIDGLIETSHHQCTTSSWNGTKITSIRTDFAGVPVYDLLIEDSKAQDLWRLILDKGEAFGVRPVGQKVLDILRIEHGIPEYGRELSEKYNPLEANLTSAISFNKGCYIGQEVVTRLNTYKKVQKRLMGIALEDDLEISGNAKLIVDQKDVGLITSWTRSQLQNKPIALAYVKTAYAKSGVRVIVSSDKHEVAGELVELPFQ